jgi:hypothetical protein
LENALKIVARGADKEDRAVAEPTRICFPAGAALGRSPVELIVGCFTKMPGV